MAPYQKSPVNSQWIIWVLLLLHFPAISQLEHLKGVHVFSIHSDNDLFRLDGRESDRYYTAGHYVSFGFGTPVKNKLSSFILSTPFRKSHSWVEAKITQQLNTPEILTTPFRQVGDYPYAASLYASIGRTTLSEREKSRYRTEVILGTIGSHALGMEFQQSLHSVVSSLYPQGWKNQLPNQFIFNYDVVVESKIVSLFSKSHLNGFGQLRVGSLYTGLQVGINLNVFTFSHSYFNDISFAKPSTKWRASFSFSPSIKWVGWNSMLQGNPFTNFANDTTYRIEGSQLYRWVACVNASFSLAKGRHALQFQQTYLGREFHSSSDRLPAENASKSVKEQLFGTIRYSFFLKRQQPQENLVPR